jgi:hypothetical protein
MAQRCESEAANKLSETETVTAPRCMKGAYLGLKFIHPLCQNSIFLSDNSSPPYFILFLSIMPLFLRIQKILIKILAEIKKNRRSINELFLEKSTFNLRPVPSSVFVEYFDLTILCLELDKHERESYQKLYFIFILILESLASHVYKLYCESDMHGRFRL